MEAETPTRKRWSLTPEAFDRLLARLDEDRGVAGERYVRLYQKLVRILTWKGSLDPEEHAAEVFSRVCRKLEEGEEIENLDGYFVTVAHYVYLESLKAPESKQEPLDDLLHLTEPFGETEADQERLDCLQTCLARLEAGDREMIIQYYQEEKSAKIDTRKALAERLGVPVNTLRMRALRIREKLEQCIKKRLRK